MNQVAPWLMLLPTRQIKDTLHTGESLVMIRDTAWQRDTLQLGQT